MTTPNPNKCTVDELKDFMKKSSNKELNKLAKHVDGGMELLTFAFDALDAIKGAGIQIPKGVTFAIDIETLQRPEVWIWSWLIS